MLPQSDTSALPELCFPHNRRNCPPLPSPKEAANNPLIRYYHILRAQTLGVLVQVLSALPMLVISVLLGRTAGFAALADFTLVVGLSAVLLVLSMLGLRTAMLKDRFEVFELNSYIAARLAGVVFLAFSTLIVAAAFDIPFILISIVVLLRIGDLALDLILAIDQVRQSEKQHLYGFLLGQTVKLAAILIAAAYIWWTGTVSDPFAPITFAAASYCAAAFYLLAAQYAKVKVKPATKTTGMARGQLLPLFKLAVPFLGASLICALLVSFPRIMLGWYGDDIAAGTVAAALTVATLAGMVFYAIWLRWSPRLGREGLAPGNILLFLAEIALILVLMLLLAALFGGRATAFVYGITSESQVDVVTETLIWSIIFFAAMTTANLFKFSRQPWIESLVFIAGLVAASSVVLYGLEVHTTGLLAAAALAMLVTQIIAAGLLIMYKPNRIKIQ